jgi:hypothetical protein
LGNFWLAPDVASSGFAVDRPPTFIGDLFSGGASEPVSDLRRRSICGGAVQLASDSHRLSVSNLAFGGPPTFIGDLIQALAFD